MLHTHRFFYLVAPILLFGLFGCLSSSSPKELAAPPMTYYFDANLGIALEHPRYWQRQKRIVDPTPEAPLTVRWAPRRRWGRAPELGMALTSLPPNRAVGGFATLLQRYMEGHPQMARGSETETELGGLPGLRLEGTTPERRLLVFFVTSAQRAVTLEFSASPGLFEANLPLFEKIAASLTILSPASSPPPGPSRSE